MSLVKFLNYRLLSITIVIVSLLIFTATVSGRSLAGPLESGFTNNGTDSTNTTVIVNENQNENSTFVEATSEENKCYPVYKKCVEIAMNSESSYVEMCQALLTCTDKYFECRGPPPEASNPMLNSVLLR